MKSTVIAVDLAKDILEIASATSSGKILERHRFNRKQFEDLLVRHEPATLVLEACGTAHHWGRVATRLGHNVRILPVQHVKPYRQGDKTDRNETTRPP